MERIDARLNPFFRAGGQQRLLEFLLLRSAIGNVGNLNSQPVEMYHSPKGIIIAIGYDDPARNK